MIRLLTNKALFNRKPGYLSVLISVDHFDILGVSRNYNVNKVILETTYKDMQKIIHPDKFSGDEEGLKAAEENSKLIIEAYHFLVSINPETIKQNLPEYTETITVSTITDYKFVEGRLIINFSNGSVYEYISVPRAIYVKMVNADSPNRFAKRHILNAYTWRKTINQD